MSEGKVKSKSGMGVAVKIEAIPLTTTHKHSLNVLPFLYAWLYSKHPNHNSAMPDVDKECRNV